jgi:NAD(P)-dependent dehydrogenase (short-subunit alcohol dehydrogenase family)
MLLAGKRIIVTGGASGIGAATVRAYAREGASVVSLDVDDKGGKAVAEAAEVSYRHCDVSDRSEVRAVFAAAIDELGGLDVLAHIAGIERGVPAEDIPEDEWDQVLDVNAKGTMLTNQVAFTAMREHGGAIINFGSAAGVLGQPGSAHYSASKGAVLAWTRTAAREWGQYGIRVNAVAPGMWTPMFDAHRERLGADGAAMLDLAMAQMVPLGGKLGDAEADMAPVMVFLASDASHFITGQTLPVDGGLMMLT